MKESCAKARGLPNGGAAGQRKIVKAALSVAYVVALVMVSVASLAGEKEQLTSVLTLLKQAERTDGDAEREARVEKIRGIYEASILPKLDNQRRAKLSVEDAKVAYEAINFTAFFSPEESIAHNQVSALGLGSSRCCHA